MDKFKPSKYLPVDGEDLYSPKRGSDGDDEECGEFSTTPSARWAGSKDSWIQRHWRSVTVHALLFAANLFLFIAYSKGVIVPVRYTDPQHEPTPFRSVVKYERRAFDMGAIYGLGKNMSLNMQKGNIDFNGPPRPELENAWDDILRYQNVRIPRKDMGQFQDDDTVIRLTDGTYYFTVSVFHGLHCVERVRKYIYKDHYYPDLSEMQAIALLKHTEHCIDYFLQYLQCNADTTLLPMEWTTEDPKPVSQGLGKHTCVNWGSIFDWVKENSFDPFEPGILMHPIFGDPYDRNASHHHVNVGLTEAGGILHLNEDGTLKESSKKSHSHS
ncbi:hypothetical protein B0H65DRAFT_186913 [Neurospora tetraspora]|uniref:Tat pathway signal sequence n=1 Tax=Neurospora tetraspora TaxID=94610 RepID=A0AAE0JF40_9PEZI|nr:hypothetical protein B0H65DRAFT_186913 [Neurospora tetraspora]